MKNSLILSTLVLLLITGLAACSGKSSFEAKAEDTGSEAQVNKTIENEFGSFKLLKQNLDIDPITTGPFTIGIPEVKVMSGTVKQKYVEAIGDKESLEYIQVDMEVAHNEEDKNSLLSNISQIKTNNGERIDSDVLMSKPVGVDFNGQGTKKGTYYFILQDSKAADIKWIHLIMDAPQNTKTFDSIGKKVDVKIRLK